MESRYYAKLPLPSNPSQSTNQGVIHEHYASKGGVGAKTASHPGFWKRYRLWILGVLIFCVIGAIIGGIVVGTRHRSADPEPHNSHTPQNPNTSSAG